MNRRRCWLLTSMAALSSQKLLTVVPGRGLQCPDVLGEAGAAPAKTGAQEAAPDARVEAHPVGHLLDVGSGQLTELGHLIDEADLGRQEGVGAVFDQLGADAVAEEAGGAGATHQCRDPLHGCDVLAADHHPARVPEVLQGGALAEELGKHDEGDVVPAAVPCEGARGPGGHRALDRDDGPGGDLGEGLVDGVAHLGEVGLTVMGGRGADRHDDYPSPCGALLHGLDRAKPA